MAYIRVSTKEQDEHIQKQAIDEFAKVRGIEIVKYYIDKGESGSKLFKERPSARKLLDELDSIKPDLIIAWALDRFGRTMLDTLNMILELENRGYKVITVREEWLQTLDTNVRKLILSILAWIAEFERRRMRERQEEAWRQGKQKGRPPKITDEEVERYLKRYPTLSLTDILDLINADRARKNAPPISYDTLRRKVKKLGYKRTLNK